VSPKNTNESHLKASSRSQRAFSLKVITGPMLNFPNQSRFFDPTRRAVRFWGHDSAMEWSFFVTEEALKRLQPKTERDEASLLLAFDTNRTAIFAAAIKAYKQGRKGSYARSRRRGFFDAISRQVLLPVGTKR
jgi:uncharacterized protein DUF1488